MQLKKKREKNAILYIYTLYNDDNVMIDLFIINEL